MDKKTKEGVRNDLIAVALWFIAMPPMMVAVIWLMGFVRGIIQKPRNDHVLKW